MTRVNGKLRLVLGIFIFAICSIDAQVYAAKPAGEPGGHLRITGIFVDFENDGIVIKGEDFDFGDPLSVLSSNIN
jgi:hypothetical protein